MLEVAVDDALLVRGLESAGELGAEAQDVLLGQRSPSKRLVERRSGDELHHQEVDPVLGVEVEKVGDVGMGEAREGAVLPAEAGASGLVGEGALGKDLEGDVAVQLLGERVA